MKDSIKIETTWASLHIMAMAFMLCDHLWATVLSDAQWMTCIGRLAFPIFAFLTVEGYFHTRDLKKYVLRLLLFAVLSEIPFDLLVSGSIVYPFHQNVLWTFLIGLGMVYWNERAARSNRAVRLAVACVSLLLGSILGLVTFVDYLHAGVLTVLVFYFFRGRSWSNRLLQLLCLGFINLKLLGGLSWEISLFHTSFSFPRQGLALLALIPIWLYRGRLGHRGPVLKWVNYLFYPVHLLILGLCVTML